MAGTNRRTTRVRGMTLIEIMVVLVILGMIASAIGYNVTKQKEHADRQTAQLEAQQLANAVDLYRFEHSALPDALEQLVPEQVKHLNRDPWGSAYVYVKDGGDRYQIISYGPDRAPGGGDDIMGNPDDKS